MFWRRRPQHVHVWEFYPGPDGMLIGVCRTCGRTSTK